MSKKLYDLTIKGRNSTWSFPLYLEEKDIKQYLNDGLKIEEIVNIFPEWIVNSV